MPELSKQQCGVTDAEVKLCSMCLLQEVQLVNGLLTVSMQEAEAHLGAAREQRPQGEELCHDGTHCKHVNGRTVVLRPEQHLRSSVPAGGYIVCEGWPGPDLPCQPKVCNLHHIPMHEQVLCSQ